MSDTIELRPFSPSFPEAPATLAAGSLVAPDITPYTTIYPSSSSAAYAGFGTLSIPLGGAQPFSYSLLFRLTSFGAGVASGYVWSEQILNFYDGSSQVGGAFVNYGQTGYALIVSYQNGSFQMAPTLQTGRWYDLTFTWDGTTASVYLDGGPIASLELSKAQVKSPVFMIGNKATNPPAKPSVGVTSGPFVGDVKRFFVWKRALTEQEVAQQMWTSPAAPLYPADVVLGYDFTTNPPTKVGSGPSLSGNGLGYASSATALFSWGSDVATPGQGTLANPGGGAPFSILGWVYLGNPAYAPPAMDGFIVSNGDQGDPNHVGLKLVGGRLAAEFGGKTVQSSTVLSGYRWYYVGVTWDGSTCTLYVDKAAVGSGTVSGAGSPASGALRLFGILNGGQPSGLLQGFLQFLSVWNVALTAEQVAAQAYEDPTLDAACTANFMMSAQPCLDSIAVSGYGLWDANELVLGQDMYVTQQLSWWSDLSGSIAEPRRTGASRVSAEPPALRLRARPRRNGRRREPAVEPFSAAHRERMVAELAQALSSVQGAGATARRLAEYRAEVDRVFDRAAAGELAGPRVSYRRVDGGWGMFYHPEAGTEIDLEVRVDITMECVVWWGTFIVTAILGIFAIFGIKTPIDDIKALVTKIVSDPAVIETLQSVTGLVFTTGTLLSFCRLLYDFGWLGQAFWMALSKLSWWAAAKFIAYVVGIFAPVASPQKVLFITNAVVTVAQMAYQLTLYPAACGTGELAAEPAA